MISPLTNGVKKTMKVFLLILIVLDSSTAFSQKAENDIDNIYLSGSLYFGDVFTDPGQLNAAVYFQKKAHLFSLQFNTGFGANSNDNGYSEYAILYGRRFNSEWVIAAFSGGLSLYNGDWEIGDDNNHYSGIGPIVEGMVMIAPLKWFAIGLKMTSTFRKHLPSPTPMLTLQLGKIR